MNTFKRIYESNYPVLYRLARKMMQQHDGVSDILQDVFTEFYNRLSRGYSFHNLEAWLYRVTFNKCIDKIRYQTRHQHRDIPEIAVDEETKADIKEALYNVLAGLSSKERKLAILYSEGLSYKDISKITGIRFTSIGKLLSRTLKKIEKELKKSGYEMS